MAFIEHWYKVTVATPGIPYGDAVVFRDDEKGRNGSAVRAALASESDILANDIEGGLVFIPFSKIVYAVIESTTVTLVTPEDANCNGEPDVQPLPPEEPMQD